MFQFSSSITLSHIFQTDAGSSSIWRERYTNAAGDAEYAEASSSSAFSMSPETSGPPRGVSIMIFSGDGGMLATVDSMRPNVVWIWDLYGTPALASALVHEQPVRQVVWHPLEPQLLINTVTNALPAVRWWSPDGPPLIVRVPTQRSESGKYDIRWLEDPNPESIFWFGSSEEYVLGCLSAEDGAVQFEVLKSVSGRGDGVL